jgi:flagellar FliL protein
MKNKFLLITMSMLFVITLILGAAVGLYYFLDSKNVNADPGQQAKNSVSSVGGNNLSAAEVKKLTVPVKDIITNLGEKERTVKASFAFEMNSSKGKTEFEDYDSRVRNVINQTLADLTMEQLSGSKGQETLKSLLINKVNNFLTEGRVKQVNITEFVMQ